MLIENNSKRCDLGHSADTDGTERFSRQHPSGHPYSNVPCRNPRVRCPSHPHADTGGMHRSPSAPPAAID